MSEPAADDWEAPRRLPAPAGMPELHLEAYDGPLDLLLELARAGKVDLAKILISDLAEQFVMAVEAAIEGRRVPLSTLGDWVVAAATLLSLRSRLLLPADTPEKREAEREADDLQRRLVERAAMQALAGWLERRQQLGRDVFARGMAETVIAGPPAVDITELLRACLKVLATPQREGVYRPAPPLLWRVPDALDHLRAQLATLPGNGIPLPQLVPRHHERVRSPVQRRAAVASTLLAGLELAREGAVDLVQNHAFGQITLAPAGTAVSPGQGG